MIRYDHQTEYEQRRQGVQGQTLGHIHFNTWKNESREKERVTQKNQTDQEGAANKLGKSGKRGILQAN